MKKLALFLLVPFLVFSSCKKDNDDPKTDPDPQNKYGVLTTYLVDNSLDLDIVLDGWIIGAPALADVDGFIADHDFLDVRNPEDFALGHINGAVNTSLASILDAAANTTKPIVVVCYTGQSAGHATMALRLSGYADAKVLKWGMSGWNSDFSAKWEANSGDNGNTAIGNANWVDQNTTPVPEFGDPFLSATADDGASILAERVQAMLDGGFKGIANLTVLDNPDNYYINNYWDQPDIDHYGCINTAYRVKPLTIANGEMKNYDPEKTAVTYCWTGQTSSMVTAYLNVIGFDAVSLAYGANGMIYDDLESHQFETPEVDLPVVIGEDPTSKFNILTDYLVEQSLDIPDVVADWIVGAPALDGVDDFIAAYDIIDIRAANDFNSGHIEGAVNSLLADVLTAAASTTKPILVVCYTGQSAAHAVVALKLSGYEAKTLKWGMSGWNPDFSASWEANSGDNGNIGIGNSNWVSTNSTPTPEFFNPALTSDNDDGASILAERVQLMLDNGFKGVPSADVLADPEEYYINNFWDQTDVDHYGCINTAYRVKPLSIADGEIDNYNPDKLAVTYCWTGQTSSMVTAYLNVIGYNAVSLKFGANSMIYDNLESHQFVTPTVSLPVVTE